MLDLDYVLTEVCFQGSKNQQHSIKLDNGHANLTYIIDAYLRQLCSMR